MIGKSPGMVLCAHCVAVDAAVECRACRRMVCAACRADVGGCTVTHAWAFGLDGFQLRAIDGSGSYGFVTRRPGLLQRTFSSSVAFGVMWLANRSWVIHPDGRRWRRGSLAGVTRAGLAVHGVPSVAEADYQSIVVTADDSDQRGTINYVTPRHVGGVTRDDLAVWAIHDNLLQRFALERVDTQRIAGLPQQLAVQAVDYDAAAQRLAIGTWTKLRVFSVGKKIEHLASVDLGNVDVLWVRYRRGHVLLLCRNELGRLELRRLFVDKHEIVPRRLLDAAVAVSGSMLCDISDNGRHMALAGRGGAIVLYDLGTGEPELLGGHAAQLTLLRFTDGDTHLISGDIDGRVVVRPRDGDRFSDLIVDH